MTRSGEIVPEKEARDLFDLVYEDLRRVAAQMMLRDREGHTLQATALVHEAFLRFSHSRPHTWENRCHFFSAAVEAMRRVLIEHARRKNALRRGAGMRPMNLDGIQVAEEAPPDTLLAIDEALEHLAEADPVKAEVVRLRFFAGCTVPEVAAIMGMGERTVKWHWMYARAWLVDDLAAGGADDPSLS